MGVGISTQNVSLLSRLQKEASIYKAAMQAVSVGLRVAMPGKIVAFDSAKQSCTVRPMVTENVNILVDRKTLKRTLTPTQIPDLLDVPMLIYADTAFALTLPKIVGSECLVVFGDMCFNAWWANGAATDSNGQEQGQNQERRRRHSLSDGFAILSPRSNPSAIQNYSNTAAEFRSLNGNAKVSIDANDNIVVKSTDGNVTLEADSGSIEINGPVVNASNYTNISNSVPVKINGTTYYIKLSVTP
jgi:hypothetical protein